MGFLVFNQSAKRCHINTMLVLKFLLASVLLIGFGFGQTPKHENGSHANSSTSCQRVGNSHQDYVLLFQQIQRFSRSRLPPRAVQSQGAGAFGVFQVTNDVSYVTKAAFLQPGAESKVAVRFSTGGGFSVKFYTKEGIHDLVGLNLPVFPIRDPKYFVEFQRSRNPKTKVKDSTSYWNFTASRPESALHTIMQFATADISSYRNVNGYGIHTFKFVNELGDQNYVKFHWTARQEGQNGSAKASEDALLQDLFNAIRRKDFPVWDLNVQIMNFTQAQMHPYNPFDITKFWGSDEFPLTKVGELTLNRNPEDYFSQVEQLAFSPSRMVPGIAPGPDPLLYTRMFAYPDAQIYRLGVNFDRLGVNYYPNSYQGWGQPLHSRTVELKDVFRRDSGDEDNFSLAKKYWNESLGEEERKMVLKKLSRSLAKAEKWVQMKFLKNIAYEIDESFGKGLEDALEKENMELDSSLKSEEQGDVKMSDATVSPTSLPFTCSDCEVFVQDQKSK